MRCVFEKPVTNVIQSFLEGSGADHRGRKLEDILKFDDSALESVHDYIQWLFPLPEQSAFNPHAPVLSAGDIAALKASSVAKANLVRAARRMEGFYERNKGWLAYRDHNHLRITRIIRSLLLLAGGNEAQHFRDKIERLVESAGNPVASEARRYWKDAMTEHD